MPQMADVRFAEGELLEQSVEAIVHPWNGFVVPWWLPMRQGYANEIRRQAGPEVFKALAKSGPQRRGAAVYTSAGRLPYRAIIHVNCLDLLRRTNEQWIIEGTRNIMFICRNLRLESVAMPMLGIHRKGALASEMITWMATEIERFGYQGRALIIEPRDGLDEQ
jgi:O-acetyl-ADP-ribose deacetylase (regulator of RNase III)